MMQQVFTRNRWDERYLKLIKSFIPKPTVDFHKGLCGKIAVVGGSFEFVLLLPPVLFKFISFLLIDIQVLLIFQRCQP